MMFKRAAAWGHIRRTFRTFSSGMRDKRLPDLTRRTAMVWLSVILAAGALMGAITTIQMRSDPSLMTKPHTPGGDQYKWNNLATAIYENGDWLLREGAWDGKPFFHYEPLYAYFLAFIFRFTGHSFFAVNVVQAFFGVLLILVVYFLAEEVFSRWVALVASFITAFYGLFLVYQNIMLKDFLAAFVLTSFLLAVVKLKNKDHIGVWCLIGALTGFTLLLKANILLLPLLAWMCFALRRRMSVERMLARVGCVLLFTVLALSPVILYNLRGTGEVFLYASGTHSFWVSNAPGVDGFGVASGIDSIRVLRQESGDSMWRALSLLGEAARNFPEAYARLFLRKFKMFWNGFEIPAGISIYLVRDYASILRMPLFGADLVMPLALVGLLLGVFTRPKSRFLALVVLFFMFSLLIFMIQARYRMPIVPVLIIFASFVICRIAAFLYNARYLHAAVLGGIVICTSFFTYTDFTCDGYYDTDFFRDGIPWWQYANFAFSSLMVMTDPERYGEVPPSRQAFLIDRSVEYLDKAIARAPEMGRLHFRMGQFQEMRGEPLKALEHYQRAVELEDDNIVARHRLLTLYQELRQ